jgi:uncharacterized repeat protein (TIGR02543 family)
MARQLFVKTSPGGWNSVSDLFVKTAPEQWASIKDVWVKVSPTSWIKSFSQTDLIPYYTVAPTLESNAYLPDVFEDGSIITLTRGTWANVSTAFDPVSYSLKIQYSADNINWTDAVTGTGTTLSYTISISDVRSPSYYFRGRVVATNKNGSSTPYLTTPILSNMNFSVASIVAYTSGGQIFSNWTFNKTNSSSNVSSQTFKIYNNFAYTYNSQYFPANSIVYSASIPVGTSLATVPKTGTNIKPGESVYAYIDAVANDTAGTLASDYSTDFTAPFSGTVTISPSFAESGGYRRVESGSTVSAVVDGFPAGTTFTYQWYRSRSFTSQDDISLGSGQSIVLTTSSSVTGERIWVDAYPTYLGQTLDTTFSGQHRIIPAPPSFTLGGGGSSITITSLTANGGEFYFGTYSGPTSGTILETPIGVDYTIPDLVTGTYTVTLYSRAINGSMFSYVVTESNTATSQQKSIVALNPPTSVSATFSSGTFYISFSGGSGPYYQVWYNTNTNPGVNNPTSLNVTSYDFNGSSSPISFTPVFVNSGVTYNFWVRSSNSLTATTPGDYSAWSSAYGQATPPVATSPTSVTASNNGSATTITVNWSGATNANYYRIYWNANGIVPGSATDYYDEEKSGSTTSWAWGPGDPDRNGAVPQSGSNYYFMVSASYDNFTWSPYTVTSSSTTVFTIQYTVSWDANGGSVSPSSNTVNSGSSVFAPSPTRSGYTFNGWYNSPSGGSFIVGAGGLYTPSASITLYAQWTIVFTPPSSGTPGWSSGTNFQRVAGSSILRWFTDYPSISGNGSFTGMQFEIRTTAGGGTLLASGQRSYPGAGSYPYSGGGTVWAFRCGTSDGDISYNAAARFARVRTVMLGTNGTTYFGSWTGWI